MFNDSPECDRRESFALKIRVEKRFSLNANSFLFRVVQRWSGYIYACDFVIARKAGFQLIQEGASGASNVQDISFSAETTKESQLAGKSHVRVITLQLIGGKIKGFSELFIKLPGCPAFVDWIDKNHGTLCAFDQRERLLLKKLLATCAIAYRASPFYQSGLHEARVSSPYSAVKIPVQRVVSVFSSGVPRSRGPRAA